jgi:hypothetical protein
MGPRGIGNRPKGTAPAATPSLIGRKWNLVQCRNLILRESN